MCVYQYVRMHNRWRFVVADVFIIKWTLAPVALHAMHCHWACVCVCMCAKSDICVWINLKLIESFCLDTLLDSLLLCFICRSSWTPEICNARKSKSRARPNWRRRHRAAANRRDRAPNKNWERSWKSRNRRAEIQNIFLNSTRTATATTTCTPRQC